MPLLITLIPKILPFSQQKFLPFPLFVYSRHQNDEKRHLKIYSDEHCLSYNNKSLVNPDRDKFKIFLYKLNNLCGKKKNYFWTVKKPSLKPINQTTKSRLLSSLFGRYRRRIFYPNKKYVRLNQTAKSRLLSSLFRRSHKDVFFPKLKPSVLSGY